MCIVPTEFILHQLMPERKFFKNPTRAAFVVISPQGLDMNPNTDYNAAQSPVSDSVLVFGGS